MATIKKEVEIKICDTCKENKLADTEAKFQCGICGKDFCGEHAVPIKCGGIILGALCKKDVSLKNIISVVEKSNRVDNDLGIHIQEINVICR